MLVSVGSTVVVRMVADDTDAVRVIEVDATSAAVSNFAVRDVDMVRIHEEQTPRIVLLIAA